MTTFCNLFFSLAVPISKYELFFVFCTAFHANILLDLRRGFT